MQIQKALSQADHIEKHERPDVGIAKALVEEIRVHMEVPHTSIGGTTML